MRQNTLALLASFACTLGVIAPRFALAQSASAPENLTNLTVTAAANLPLQGSVVGKARCDDEGNIYFRSLDAETSRQHHAVSKLPIQKVSVNGGLWVVFRMSDDPSDLLGSDFFVTGDGRVYLAARRRSDQSACVLEFSNAGKFLAEIPLGQRFIPRQIVVYKSGEMLLGGTDGELNHTPFTAVFDAAGNLIKKIYEPEDEYARTRADVLDPTYVRAGTTADNTSVVHGDAALGSDGNAYLLRATSPALIYVISSKGEVVRKLHVKSPSSGLVAQRLKSSKGRLAIVFLEEQSTAGRVKIVDLNGNMVAEHASNDQSVLPGLPGCYDSLSFTFLRPNERTGISLQKAEPK